MKHLILAVAVSILVIAADAQQKEGTVTYQRKTNTWKFVTNEQFRANVPEFQTANYVLYFSDTASLYKLMIDDNALEPFAGADGGGGGGRRFSFGGFGGDGELYKNLNTGLSTQATELGGKNFLIIDTIKKAPWKISAETKQILGFNCRKAIQKVLQPIRQQRTLNFNRNNNTTAIDTAIKPPAPKEIEVVAWFAETIMAPVGPDNYGKLPGVILELNVDNDAVVYVATSVKETVDIKAFKEPKKGKKVTKSEYAKLMMELFKNQGGGAGGGQIMIRSNNM